MNALSQRLGNGVPLVAPGVYDPLSAILAQTAGCEAIFVSGNALAVSQLGMPDFGLLASSELIDCVARICDRVSVPVLVDGDSGYGNAAHLQRLVRGVCRAGAAGVQIEDQVAVKPPGALQLRPLVSIAEMVGKIHAAQDARLDDGFLISARTDAMSTTNVDDALERAAAYVDAGCDLLFLESLVVPADIARLMAQLGGSVPLVHNMLEGGGTPYGSALEAGAAGFALLLFPSTALSAAATALAAIYAAIVRDGSSAAVLDRLGGVDLKRTVGAGPLAHKIAAFGDPH